MRGGMEAVYDDVPVRLGFGQFAPMQPARGPMFSARMRAKLACEPRPQSSKKPSFMTSQVRSSSQERPRRPLVRQARELLAPHYG